MSCVLINKATSFKKTRSPAIHGTTLCLSTFASADALDPRMIKLCVAVISAVLEPSTAASTTAAFPVPFGSAALETPNTTVPCHR